jgi:hypothetical protein
MPMAKRGKWSNPDIQFLRDHPEMSEDEVAKILDRTADAVRKQRLKLPAQAHNESYSEPLAHLRTLYFWSTVQGQLINDEQTYFEQQWCRFWEQFSHNDVLATDEVMIKDAILLDIMANRALTFKASQLRRSTELSDLINEQYDLSPENRNQVLLANLETQYGACQAAIVDSTKEFLEYQKKKDDKMTQLKATRDQRLKQTEQSGKNFWELCRMLEDKKKRLKDSVLMTRMKVAADRVKEDWSENTHRFADDEFDKILLIPNKETKDE